ncbi:MAG: hypothetical protein QM703_28625 [Gemmatales bacterium]
MIKTKSSRSRLCRLEELEEQFLDQCEAEHDGPLSGPEILEYYQRCSETRLFDREPDFKATLNEFERLLESIPPQRHQPAQDFEPDKPERRRLWLWGIRHEILELRLIYEKLSSMCNRAFQGLEGVSHEEFAQRKLWFQQNIDELPMHYMIAVDGTTEPRINTVETALYQGPDSAYALNAILTLREWEQGHCEKGTTYGDWRRERQERLAKR